MIQSLGFRHVIEVVGPRGCMIVHHHELGIAVLRRQSPSEPWTGCMTSLIRRRLVRPVTENMSVTFQIYGHRPTGRDREAADLISGLIHR